MGTEVSWHNFEEDAVIGGLVGTLPEEQLRHYVHAFAKMTRDEQEAMWTLYRMILKRGRAMVLQ